MCLILLGLCLFAALVHGNGGSSHHESHNKYHEDKRNGSGNGHGNGNGNGNGHGNGNGNGNGHDDGNGHGNGNGNGNGNGHNNKPCIPGQCYYRGGKRSQQNNANSRAIRILQGNWLGARVDTKIAEILIQEKLGYPVSIVPVQPNGQGDVFKTVVDGTAHVMMECWPFEHVQQKIDYPSVEHDSLLGVVGTSGWYIPTWLANQEPSLATYQGLQNAALVQQYLTTPESGTKAAILHGGSEGSPWITGVDDIIAGLNLDSTLQKVFSADDSEDTHVAAIAAAVNPVNTGIPRLFFFYSPHAAFSQYELTRVDLGDYDYEAEDTFKAMYGDLRHYNLRAYQLLRAIFINNDIQSEIMGRVTFDGLSETDAVCDWLKTHDSLVDSWIPKNSKPPKNYCRP